MADDHTRVIPPESEHRTPRPDVIPDLPGPTLPPPDPTTLEPAGPGVNG